MNRDAQKMLSAAMDRLHYAQVELQNIGIRGNDTIKVWKVRAKANPGEGIKTIMKNAVPALDKLVSKSKTVIKELDKLQDAGDDHAEYYDGMEFRSRTEKLMRGGKELDQEAAKVIMTLKSIGIRFPEDYRTEVIPTVKYVQGYMERWNELKIAINRI